MSQLDEQFKSLEKFQFQSPTCSSISGPSGSGKSELVFKIIKDRHLMFSTPPSIVIYCYRVWQDRFQDLLNENKGRDDIIFHQGIYDISKLKSDKKHKLLILDDLMSSIDKSIGDLFCVQSHHTFTSCFYINQNLYNKNPYARDISLNSQYIILFKQRRDLSSLRTLGMQLFPKKFNDFISTYNQITLGPFSYMLIDIHPANIHRVVLRSNILPNEIETVYIPTD